MNSPSLNPCAARAQFQRLDLRKIGRRCSSTPTRKPTVFGLPQSVLFSRPCPLQILFLLREEQFRSFLPDCCLPPRSSALPGQPTRSDAPSSRNLKPSH